MTSIGVREGTKASVQIESNHTVLQGDLTIPENAIGAILFAHGSGSSRHSPRNQFVAGELQKSGLATLLIDLLTTDEERIDDRTAQLRFDIPFLAERLGSSVNWLGSEKTTRRLSIGLFGASTGAAAALVAAASMQTKIGAVVSRGGRPDLAGGALPTVACPTLLIVGGDDGVVIDLNRRALARLRGTHHELVIIPGAGHLFEEPGTLNEVARLASNWFTRHLGGEGAS